MNRFFSAADWITFATEAKQFLVEGWSRTTSTVRRPHRVTVKGWEEDGGTRTVSPFLVLRARERKEIVETGEGREED